MSDPISVDDERHRLRTRFGSVADLYDRARAGYAVAAIDWALPAGASRVLDLAAGTGKLTAALLGRGLEVIAIDLSAEMLDVLRTNLTGVAAGVDAGIGLDVRVGSAEATGLPSADVDAVLIGSAVHWFDRPSADREIARVLRPGGIVATFSNRRDRTVAWVAALEQVVGRRSHKDRVERSESRRAPFDATLFGPPETADFPFTQPMDADLLAGLYASRSYVIDMNTADRDRLLADIVAFARTHPDLAGRDTFELPYRTVVTRYALR